MNLEDYRRSLEERDDDSLAAEIACERLHLADCDAALSALREAGASPSDELLAQSLGARGRLRLAEHERDRRCQGEYGFWRGK